MDFLREYFLILLPLIILQITLALVALVHVLRHPNYRFGNKAMWVAVVCLISTIGPIVYFVFGRGEQ